MNVSRPRGTYCLKAAARCAPLLVAAGFAAATPLPTPPCGTPPVPAYASLGAQPAMTILRAGELDTGVWRPSACTGWPAASRSRVVVAVAGLVRVGDGPETLLGRAGAVSTLRTVRYWSTTDKKWRPLFLDAAALSAEGGERRGDFRPSELQAGGTYYYWVDDSRSGPLVYRVRVLEHSPHRVALAEENVSPVRAFGLMLFQPAALQTVVFAQRQTNDVWGLYILVRIDQQASSFMASGHEASTANRALALFRHLAGIPTDADPPAVR
ncbi:hypothetical protein B0G81_7756 [Paraburkholderia sp. BL6665CI2N2]|uniref:DUF6675 family protein n=1 Tax=Paraburkholderia sp. BL6665CI2N2 TaxID=1938806 RepID=UPI001065602B|nr:DUF6675 family protein [Paraburkholderia sp. BL6665CI2N2]TDY16679.1 hypothetical protein B0G81_7756 [Paraburkholderia sp. BL6665CI2N2]